MADWGSQPVGRFMPPHRARSIARARGLCWALAGLDALLLTAMLVA